MNTNTITQPRMTDLDILKGARKILETNWCAFWAFHPDGVRHCALGAMYVTAGHHRPHGDYEWLVGLTNPSARALYPELRGAVAERSENGDSLDSFDLYPTVYVNNHLGREAILRVFDAAILDIELRLSIESGEPQIEMEKQEAIA